MDMESRLKMIMAEGLRGIRGPFYNAHDYPSFTDAVDYDSVELMNTGRAEEKHTGSTSVYKSELFQLQSNS